MNPLTHFRKITILRFVLLALLCLGFLLLISYTVLAQPHRGDAQPGTSNDADRVSSTVRIPDFASEPENENEPEVAKKRREWMDRFFSLGSVSPAAYGEGLAAARALPMSRLVRGRGFAPSGPLTQAWTSPIPPPILNDDAGNGTTRIQALSLAPNPVTDVVYTGSFGGLAKSTDGGGSWQYLSDTWDSQAVACIAVDPQSPSHVYVGTGMNGSPPLFAVGLYGSTDAGATWTNLGATPFGGTLIRAIAVDPNNTSTLYVANARSHDVTYPPGLYGSTDGGMTWAIKRPAGTHGSKQEWDGMHSIAIDGSTQPSTLYVTDDTDVLRSTDSGESWGSVFRLYACASNNRCVLSRLSVVSSTVYVVGDVGQYRNLYMSTDRGIHWSQVPTPCPRGSIRTCVQPCPLPCPPYGCNNIGLGIFAVDPNNTQIILGGTNGLFRTTNGGSQWTEMTTVHPDHRIFAFSPDHPGVVYEGNDGGIIRSTDHGQTWTNLNQSFPGVWLYSVALSQDGTMIGGTQDAGVIFSDPLIPWGRAWDMIHGGDSFHNLIDPENSTVAYLTQYGDQTQGFWRITRPAPGATPAPEVDIRPSQFANDCACDFFPTFSMNPLAPTHIIAACQRVVRTLSGPNVKSSGWKTIGPGPLPPNPCATPPASKVFVTAASEAPSNSDVIYAVTNSNMVYVTTDANQNENAHWYQRTQLNQPGGIHAVTVDPTSQQIAYLACDSDVYKTTDTGSHWSRTASPDNVIYHDVAINPVNPKQVFAASNAGVLVSTDGGGSWANMSAGGIPAGMLISALSFNNPSQNLAAATIGRGVYLINLGP
jgi:photosystem II stability/assembly factor-like uncharacterized protein